MNSHLVCVITVVVLFVATIAAEWREWRTDRQLERRTNERDELAIANANLLEERCEWRDENARLHRIVDGHTRWLVQTACLSTAERNGLDDDTLMAAFENLFERSEKEGFPGGVDEQPDGGDQC